MRTTCSIVVLCGAALLAWQDPPTKQEPVKPAVRQVGESAPPAMQERISESTKAPVGVPKRHRYEGVYRLSSVMLGGSPEHSRKRGYLAITGQHVMMMVAADGSDPEAPLISAGIRRWQEDAEGMRTTVELDFFNDHSGELHFMPPGLTEVRGIELLRGGMRLRKDAQTWMDFERIE